MTAATSTDARAAWAARAGELADWALARFFVRTDRYGGYYAENGETRKCARPATGTQPGFVTRALLMKHFRANQPADVVGAYYLTPEPDCRGRAVSADIDAHDADADPEQNRKYAEHLYGKLTALGFRPLLATWGGGSFHLHVLFDRDQPGAVLHAFGRWLVSDADAFGYTSPVESFPKQAVVKAGKFGNWLRTIGRHHTRDAWASVFDGSNWLDGAAAVAHILSLPGDAPDLIPQTAPSHPAPGLAPAIRPPARTPADPHGRPDVFEEYLRRVDMAEVVGWLEKYGHRVTSRGEDRVEFVRAGKDGAGSQSFNVKLVSGCPITYSFSTNAGLPDGKGLSPVQLRCFLMFGSTDTAAMAKLADVLKEELGWRRPDPPRALRPAPRPRPQPAARDEAEDDGPQTGAQIILAHFRELYAPVFKSGTAIQTADGNTVPMGEATALCDSRLIDNLEAATDAPRYAPQRGVPGEVKRDGLPGFFKKWVKVAWGDLLRELPDEDAAVLDASAPTAEVFRQRVREALLAPIVLGEVITDDPKRGAGAVGTQVERRSMIDWCAKFAKPGPWRSIRSYKCWCRCRDEAGEVVLMIAVRHELFAQLKADRGLTQMTANTFSSRAVKYGLGTSDRKERPHGMTAVVLDEKFVADLLQYVPEEGADAADQAA